MEICDRIGRIRVGNVSVYNTLLAPPEPTLILNITSRLQAATVFLEAVRDEIVVGNGTGFLIAVAPPLERYADILLVTARHNVYGAIARGASVNVLFKSTDEGDLLMHEIPAASWVHSAHDISVALLDLEKLPEGLSAVAVDSRRIDETFPFNGGSLPVLIYGRGRVGLDQPLLVRSANLMTSQQARVRLSGCSGAERVWIAEGLVTSGMSGGPVALVKDGVWITSIVGLVAAYAYDDRESSANYAIQMEEVNNLRTELLREIAAVRQNLIYVAPSKAIQATIEQCIFQKYPDRSI